MLAIKKAKLVKNPDDITTPETLKTVEITAGKKGAWNKSLNKPEPNTIYEVDGNKTYKTDDQGRVTLVEGNLTLSKKDRNTYQQRKAGKSGLDADEGGHLFASIFDGPGEKLNLVPMDANLNKGAWKKMENLWANALENGERVSVKIIPKYKNDNLRPDSFIVRYKIGNGKVIRESYKNSPEGK